MKNKHLTDSERYEIEHWLQQGLSLVRIATILGKSTSTISREIRAHSLKSNKVGVGRIKNSCTNRFDCTLQQICYDKPNCVKKCRLCKHCNDMCKDYREQICHRLCEPPYVCNGCLDERKCYLRKRFYVHKKAHEAYREMLRESRSGANISEYELNDLDNWVIPLLFRGHSIHHVAVHNPDLLNISEKTLYRYVLVVTMGIFVPLWKPRISLMLK